MDPKDFAEILNNSKDLTIGQIFKLLLKIKYKTIALFVVSFLAITGSAYVAGQSNVKHETAVMLQSPFSMRIVIDESTHDFDKLTLIEDPTLPSPTQDTITLSLRHIVSSFDIVPVGQVVAKVDATDSLPVWDWVFSKIKPTSAHARTTAFDWNGHENDHRFKVRQINNNTIHRYYSDGCILQYNIDSYKRSIPSSFVWIKKTH